MKNNSRNNRASESYLNIEVDVHYDRIPSKLIS